MFTLSLGCRRGGGGVLVQQNRIFVRGKWLSVLGADADKNEVQAEAVPKASDLRGRDLINFDHWNRQDILSLLWLALDLKSKEGVNANLCKGTKTVCLYEDLVTKTGIVGGVTGVGAVVSSIHLSHLSSNLNLDLFARSLSSQTGAIFVDSSSWSGNDLHALAAGSVVPVLNVRSSDSAPLYCLAECLTLFEYYGFLRRLTYAYLGSTESPVARTYIGLFPKIGMHFRYFSSSTSFPNDMWTKGISFSEKSSFRTDLLHFATAEEAIWRAHVIVATPETDNKLTPKSMKEADLNWTFLHHDIHKGTSCSNQLVRAKQSLVWKCLENLEWITKAALVATTAAYKPTIPYPNFAGVD